MKSADNVATCLTDLAAGAEETIAVDDSTVKVQAKDDIPFGHKIALTDLATGDAVIKYAEIIGLASQPITAGEHVHVHNVESVRARGDKA